MAGLATGRGPGLRAMATLLVLALHMLACGPARAEAPAAPPEKVQEFIRLLDDPAVRQWLETAKQVPLSAETAAQGSPAGTMEKGMVSSGLDRFRNHLAAIAAAWPLLPRHFEAIGMTVMTEIDEAGLLVIAALVILFIALGLAVSYGVFRLARPLRLWTISLDRASAKGRAGKFAGRFMLGVLMLSGFGLGSMGTFLLFEWPPLLREIVLAFLTAALIVWAVRMVTITLLLPSWAKVEHARAVRAFDIDNPTADHWHRWLLILAAVITYAGAVISLLPRFGFTPFEILALEIPVDCALMVLASLAFWRRPAPPRAEMRLSDSIRHAGLSWLATLTFIGLFAIRTAGAYSAFWFLFACAALPLALVLASRSVRYILRPSPDGEGASVEPVTVAVVDRALRLALIGLAAYLLAKALGLDSDSMRSADPVITRLSGVLLKAAIIFLAADFAWSIIKAVVRRKLGAQPVTSTDEDAVVVLDPRQARLRTLLPIVQNILFAAILVLSVLMALSTLGIDIGPLIAGAGVVGVAVGFGAQTLVKDVIAGIFYLFDEAFRVGEHISSGKYTGTVESFSLRSVKLRHHRGPLFTIPFGELGAVRNESRDWTTDKFNITVGFETDLEKARKLIKRVGLELAEDPEYKPWIIEPIKMQGVQEFGEYGIVLRMKVTTRPGGAFSMKRKFYARIKQVFKENQIELPVPTIHVQSVNGHEQAVESEGAALQQYLKKRAAEAEGKEAETG